MIYLDNASTTQVDAALSGILYDYTFNYYGNAGSPHLLGQISKEAIHEARKTIALSLDANINNVIFTSSGSESNSLAVVGMSNYLNKNKLNHIITTKYEHRSILSSFAEMERRGFYVTYLDVSDGTVSCDELGSCLRPDTGLVSVMCVNNEIGCINDIQNIYSLCKSKNIFFHSDCVQAFGSIPINMEMADAISISGHKIHAPKGIGCLCTKHKEYLSNIIYGGNQESGIRPGTENVPNIVAFGDVVGRMLKNQNTNIDHIYKVSSCFYNTLVELCEKDKINYHFNTPNSHKSPKIISVRFDGVDAETLMMLLNENGVCVSAGSACSSNFILPSYVLKAIGLSNRQAMSTIRISFSEHNTTDEAYKAAKIIVDAVKQLSTL